jgi:hypothetical protein
VWQHDNDSGPCETLARFFQDTPVRALLMHKAAACWLRVSLLQRLSTGLPLMRSLAELHTEASACRADAGL